MKTERRSAMKTTKSVSHPADAVKSVALAVVLGVAGVLGAGPFARAEIITIDVNSPDNVAQNPSMSGPAGDSVNWNNLVMADNWSTIAATNLVDGAGTVTAVGISLRFPYRDPWGEPALQMLQSGVYNPGVGDWGESEINGLTPGGKYGLYIAGSRVNDDTGANGTFHINGQARTLDNGDPPRNGETWVQGVNYVFFDGLVADENGKISFQVCDGPLFISGVQIVDAGAPPGAPPGLAATPTDSQVVLSWTTSPGASSYNVKRSTMSDSGYVTIGTPSVTTFTDAGVVNGMTYYYVVTALNGAGESAASAEVSATPFSTNDILSFGPGAIIRENTIVWNVPLGTDVTALAPTFALSDGATCDPVSGTTRNFTSPQTYVVSGADGSHHHYVVTVMRAIHVNIDTGTRTGLAGPAGGAGAVWNERLGTAGLTASQLLDASGAATSVGFTCNATNVDPWGDPALTMLAGAAFNFDNTQVKLVLNGLDAGKKYALHIASFYPNELGGKSLFSTTNPTTTQGVQVADNLGPHGNSFRWVRGVNHVRFDNLEPDSAKRITVTMTSDSGAVDKRAYLSGFQLLEAPGPEPDPYAEWIAGVDFSAFTNPDLTPSGDPDGDGLTNLVEYAYGLDPSVAENFANGLTRERWDDIPGSRVADLTGNRSRFLLHADERVLVPRVDEGGHGDSYGSRYRGFITAPVTGTYHFWIAGHNEAELWLADGTIKKTIDGQTVGLTNRYGKQRIAWVEDPRFGLNQTAVHEFDKFPSQCSRPVQLEAGHKYYFEVLHKQDGGNDNVAVAWQPPGSTREIIPTTAFNGDFTQDDDLDDDNLPAAWELANGLNPADNGLSDSRDGQYGDWDADGLTNLEEYQIDTNPQSGDIFGRHRGSGGSNQSGSDARDEPGEPLDGVHDDGREVPFPMEALPPILRRIVEGTAMETMLPEALVASAALATLAASIGAGLQVRVGRYTTPANLAILIALASGLGKDDVFRYIVRPLVDLDSRLRQYWEQEIKPELEEELVDACSRLKTAYAARRKAEDPEDEDLNEEIKRIKLQIAEIQRQLKRCPKITMTAPGKIQLGLDMMNQDGEACAILTPEGRDSVFKVGDEGFYCAAISGTRVEDSRVTRQSMRLECPCLTILLMAQPEFVTRQLERERMVDSGLMPRFLIYFCAPDLPAIPADQPVMHDTDTEAWKELTWRTVATFRLRKEAPFVINVGAEVNRLFLEYENENRARRGQGGNVADVKSFAARWTEQAVKLAIVLHVGLHGADAADHPISVETARNAIRIGRWFSERQIEALFMHRNEWLRRRAEKLREKILNIKSGKAKLGELASAGWSNGEVRELARRYPGLISIVNKPIGKQGGRPTEYVKAV